MTLRISPDGTVSLATPRRYRARRRRGVSLMPAAFPRGPIEVGYTWSRDMPAPGGGRAGPGGTDERLAAHEFRLDSVTHRGTMAYVSMHGDMSPDPDAGSTQRAGPVLEHGLQ